ncbi:NYN domain-containing protein [Thiobacillus sp.]|uniref:NYN domain-containing protein n=1 Tax=Thiobacillus sp. TaxID=924 RepID=UPI001828617F|nr:NYN domain-containing protein [Thiobacillus sp.]MBC2730872.1 NYN domain-containing protein [Thiobacillus sp.]MBC2739609.1 NYN domain-containing protein [Thiobacillus sp.]MBC2760108.1 NYN domain-containing protein [Thiobacillus sp.]
MATPDIRNIAVFCDFENVAIGIKEASYPEFKIRPVLERLLLKGSIVVKKAYCDWDRYKEYKRDMHEAAFELIEIPHVRQSGKNSADIRMVVDALDLCYTKSHIDAFVIISGDSDFSPLISKLKENGKSVIGIGVRGSASSLLIGNCDEFIFYEDLVKIKAPSKVPARKPAPAAPAAPAKEAVVSTPKSPTRRRSRPTAEKSVAADEGRAAGMVEPTAEDKKSQAIELVVGTVEQLVAERGGEGSISASLIKSTIKRIRPGFSESEYGYSAFGKILDDAHKKGVLVVDKKEGGAVIVSLPPSRG